MTAASVDELRVGAGVVRLVRADITTLRADAVVNAANAHLAGGGGVDGVIHRAAGHADLQAELGRRYPQGCPTGSAVVTGAYGLQRNEVRQIVHAVGPRVLPEGDGFHHYWDTKNAPYPYPWEDWKVKASG